MSERGIVTNGLVIRAADHGDNDRLVTALTAERGKLFFTAKGIKSTKNKNRAGCSLFSYSEFVLNERGGYYVLSECTPRKMFPGIEKDIESMYVACYICEVVDFVCMDGAEENDILRLALNSLYALSEKIRPADFVKTVFETRLLLSLGVMPPFDGCALCGSDDEKLYFSLSDGDVLCQSCLSREEKKDAYQITPEALKFFTYENSCDHKKIYGTEPPDECASGIAERYLVSSLGRGFVSLSQYKKLKKK
ncbi:MAG: DNA repair protein RecO [Clostridia bacterium]|nr:DNA repair protein RecO [Clostridia bacterium]